MTLRKLCTRLLFCLALSSFSAVARAEMTVEACSEAYTSGQEERLAGRAFLARSKFQTCSARACPAVIADDCRRWVSEVEAELPSLRVRVQSEAGGPVPGLRVTLDGAAISADDLRSPLVVDAGPHELSFEAPGYAAVHQQRSLRPEQRNLDIEVVLRPAGAAAAPPPVADSSSSAPSEPFPVVAASLAGGALVALGASVYLGLSARSDYDALKRECAPRCEPSRSSAVHSKALASDLLLAGSVAALGAAAWIYFGSRAEPSRPSTAFGLTPQPSGAAIIARMTF